MFYYGRVGDEVMSIKITNLSYSYNSKSFAVKDVTTSIKKGSFVSIVGHTGSGKSTFVQNLNALLIPTSGTVTVDEFTIENKLKIKNIKALRKKIGIVFQFPEYQLFEETIERDILFGPKNFDMKEEELSGLASKVLNIVGLDDTFLQKSPFELSGGEKRRVAIAGILAFDPDVLIVDEPTAGLDPISSNKMMELFKKLNEMGKTIILVTHNMDHVLEYSDRVLVFKEASLCYDGTPIELFNDIEKVKSLEIDIPNVILLTNMLKAKHSKLADYKIKSVADFIKAYKDVISL